MELAQDGSKTQRRESSGGQQQHELQVTEEVEYDLTEVTLSKNTMQPIPIDGEKEIMKLLHSGVLKGIENAKVREKFVQAITLDRVGKVFKLSFYFILASNFPECIKYEEEQEVIDILKKKLSKNYVKLFSILPQPKDEIVNMIIFCLGYASHYLFYQLFQKQRELFDLRFVFNCYHILIFEFNGIFVSDFFIRMNIDKIFHQTKFLDYERANKKNLILQQQAKNKAKVKTFFGFNLPFPELQNQDGQSFMKSVQEKFKPPKVSVHHQDDHITDLISSQEKQSKIKGRLKEKRIKQIEECEMRKMATFSSTLPILRQQSEIIPQDHGRYQTQHTQEDEDNDTERQRLLAQMITKKKVTEKAEEIFQSTAVRTDEDQSKQDQNYFSNLQMNCNQISPTISDVLAYDHRTLPFAKKKMIRHAFETVNDKEDNLLTQLKQFSQSRKQKKETKLTQKVSKNIIDHFGLRPPPREYYQKHPKLDKMFKEMLDINYVLKQNKESMNQLPSSVQMHQEQANEWQQAILDQEMSYNKNNQRQKMQENMDEVIRTNSKYQLEKRIGYRKKYIYTKPLQYMKKTNSIGNLLQEDATQSSVAALTQLTQSKPVSRQHEPPKTSRDTTTQFLGQTNSSMPNLALFVSDKPKQAASLYFPSIDPAVNEEKTNNFFSQNQIAVPSSMPSPIKTANAQFSSVILTNKLIQDEQKTKKNIKPQEELDTRRTLEYKMIYADSKDNRDRGMSDTKTTGYKGQNNKQQGKQNEFYSDKRKVYKERYKGILNGMNTDNNIEDIMQSIIEQRNLFKEKFGEEKKKN